MDLLNENQYEKPKQAKGKNIILLLLILSVIAVIAIIAAMIFLESNKVIEKTLYINEEQKEISAELFVTDASGNQYISLKELAVFLGYEYYNSEYNNDGIDTTKCYIKNGNMISGFELGTNEMYKYEEGTTLDYQYYSLNNKIITYNNKLYIAIADLTKALNMYCTVGETNAIKLYSMEYLSTLYQEKLKDTGFTVTTEQNNQKALAYGWIIVNKNGTWSVLNTKLEEIIDAKYKSMYFDEKNSNYIVSNLEGKYGIISATGTVEQLFKYDKIKLLNYENMLYQVEYNKKYGIMTEDGKMLTEIIYDKIGYEAEPNNKILYTLIIPKVDDRSGPVIVVRQGEFYGLVKLQTGESLLPCDHVEKIYSINELGDIVYKVYVQEQTMGLKEYLELREKATVELN